MQPSLVAASLLILIITIVDAVNPSPGCSLDSPPLTSGSWSQVVSFDGVDRTHEYSYPDNSNTNNSPAKLLLYFHGWGGSPSECGSTCTEASQRGYATIAMEGIGGESSNNNSWKFSGSVDSGSGSDDKVVDSIVQKAATVDALDAGDRTCNTDAYDVTCYSDCGKEFCNTNDGCFWTTCKDSVGQVVSVLETFLEEYCIDMDRVYAVGCSNGGMFTYELANDARSAKYIAGISSQVGLPQYGYNLGPNLQYPVHHFGFWGSSDGTVPPEEDGRVACRTSEDQGWFYTSSECTMNKWAEDYGINNSINSNQADYGISSDKDLTQCTIYGDSRGGPIVGGCLFNGGHDCGLSYLEAFDFFEMHPKIFLPTTEPTNAPSTGDTTINPTTAQPSTANPTTVKPTLAPSTRKPTWRPTTAPSTTSLAFDLSNLISKNSEAPTSQLTRKPSSLSSSSPTADSNTATPSKGQSEQPTASPLNAPITLSPTLLSANAPSWQPSTGPLNTTTPNPTLKSSDTSIQSTRDPTLSSETQLTEANDTQTAPLELDNASGSVFSSLAIASVSFVFLLYLL